jgi:ketosteroid isomerase-like protein
LGLSEADEETILFLIKSGDVKLEKIDVDEEQARVYGNTAVITGRAHVLGAFKGQAFDRTARYTRVWVKLKGAWKLVSFHETLIPEPAK